MPMHYILDGYNVIHKIPEFEKLLDRSLQSARMALLRFCKSLLQSRGDVAKITVIFDGASDIHDGAETGDGVEVLFTQTGEDADDRILDYLKQIPARGSVVVTDDNYIRNNAKVFEARILSVREFLDFAIRKKISVKSANGSRAGGSEKGISLKKQKDITRAYADYLGLGE